MVGERPHLVVLAGPNGAGKSTSAPALLVGTLAVTEFVNADVIAQGLSAFHPEQTAFDAGRIMLARLRQLAEQRISFAFETTLASRTFAHWISELRQSGYRLHLIFLWLPTPELALSRVEDRVRLGGHDIPPETIRRRYHAGLTNFFRRYQPLADTWQFLNNSEPSGARLIAAGVGAIETVVEEREIWQTIRKGIGNEPAGQGSD